MYSKIFKLFGTLFFFFCFSKTLIIRFSWAFECSTHLNDIQSFAISVSCETIICRNVYTTFLRNRRLPGNRIPCQKAIKTKPTAEPPTSVSVDEM